MKQETAWQLMCRGVCVCVGTSGTLRSTVGVFSWSLMNVTGCCEFSTAALSPLSIEWLAQPWCTLSSPAWVSRMLITLAVCPEVYLACCASPPQNLSILSLQGWPTSPQFLHPPWKLLLLTDAYSTLSPGCPSKLQNISELSSLVCEMKTITLSALLFKGINNV